MKNSRNRFKQKLQKQPRVAQSLTDDQLSMTAVHLNEFFQREWFGELFDKASRPYMVRLLLASYICYGYGALLTKNDAMREMNAVDGRTSQRYINLAQQKGLLTVHQSELDKRVDLLCPTKAMLAIVRDELTKITHKIVQVSTAIAEPSSNAAGKAWFDKGGYLARLLSRGLYWEDPEALAHVSEAIRLSPTNIAAHRERARLHVKSSELKKALADLTAAIRLAPEDPYNHFARGELFLKQLKDSKKAIADFTAAIQRGSKAASVHHDLAWFYVGRGEGHLREGNRELAALDFEAAAALNPETERVTKLLTQKSVT